MPRKVSYGHAYDEDRDDYDDYDDYDDDYDYSHDTEESKSHQNGTLQKSSQINEKAIKPALWKCSICTFDNDESLVCCDICGVFRDSFVKSGKDVREKVFDAVNGTSRDSGTSIMAKSLSTGMAKVDLTDDFQRKKASTSYQKVYDLTQSTSTMASSSVNNIKRATLPPESDLLLSASLSKAYQLKEDNSMSDSAMLPSNIKQLNFVETHKSNTRDNSYSQYKPEKWMMDQLHDASSQLNLAIVGHVDSGKSTLSGKLLHLLGRISKREMHKHEKEAKEKGKGSFAYAWAMDESTEERERGVTMNVGVAYFESKKYRVVLLDSPGHKDFVPNMISGAAQADAAILVIDACMGSFEAGMTGNGFGQTKEHAQLTRSFGVDQMIVAVNKMDAIGYSKDRFDFIKAQLGSFLRLCGFRDSLVTWVPLSAIENQNVVSATSDARLSCWFQGPCLLDAIDSLQPPSRDVSKPLIIPICDVIKSHTMGQVSACGKLETGAIRNGSKVLVMPSRELATVRSIEQDSNICGIARAGDNVAVGLQGVDWSHVMPGGVLCHPDFPVLTATCLELKILVLDVATPILAGSQVEFHIHHAKEAARVTKIVSLLDQKTGKTSKRAPRFLKAKQSAIIQVNGTCSDLEVSAYCLSHTECSSMCARILQMPGSWKGIPTIIRKHHCSWYPVAGN
ncbi:uncharacterized protein [Typha latifolia]|uniref:uncharacterized protein isoform X2 n=1 Tax=Typha latifolia TaxID=4733 RepID=UPI003C2AB685